MLPVRSEESVFGSAGRLPLRKPHGCLRSATLYLLLRDDLNRYWVPFQIVRCRDIGCVHDIGIFIRERRRGRNGNFVFSCFIVHGPVSFDAMFCVRFVFGPTDNRVSFMAFVHHLTRTEQCIQEGVDRTQLTRAGSTVHKLSKKSGGSQRTNTLAVNMADTHSGAIRMRWVFAMVA